MSMDDSQRNSFVLQIVNMLENDKVSVMINHSCYLKARYNISQFWRYMKKK